MFLLERLSSTAYALNEVANSSAMRNIIITSDRTYREDLNNDRSQIQGHCFNADSQEAYMLTAGNQVLRFGDSDYQARPKAQRISIRS